MPVRLLLIMKLGHSYFTPLFQSTQKLGGISKAPISTDTMYMYMYTKYQYCYNNPRLVIRIQLNNPCFAMPEQQHGRK